MKLTEKQAMMLCDIAKWAERFANTYPGGYSRETIRQLNEDIINQQSNEPIELD